MSSTFEELKENILREFDPDMLLEILGITSEQLLDRFEDQLMKNIDLFTQEDTENV